MPAKKKSAKPKGPLVDLDSAAVSPIKFYPFQEEAFLNKERSLWMIMRRQAGKSFLLGHIGMSWMMEAPNTEVLYVSASLRLGIENIRKEAEVWRKVMEQLRLAAAMQQDYLIKTAADDDKGNLLDVDAIADLFEHQKLETKLWHSNTNFSRSLVVAPNPDTAVGWAANLILDEVGRMPEFKAVMEAVGPIISSSPHLRMRGATTPPPDDAHHSYDLLAPKEDAVFPVNPRGNYYESAGDEPQLVLRADAWDVAAAGRPMYAMRSVKAITPEESRSASGDKTGWDRNYGCKFVRGGASALPVLWLNNAQAAGADHGVAIDITEPMEAA